MRFRLTLLWEIDRLCPNGGIKNTVFQSFIFRLTTLKVGTSTFFWCEAPKGLQIWSLQPMILVLRIIPISDLFWEQSFWIILKLMMLMHSQNLLALCILKQFHHMMTSLAVTGSSVMLAKPNSTGISFQNYKSFRILGVHSRPIEGSRPIRQNPGAWAPRRPKVMISLAARKKRAGGALVSTVSSCLIYLSHKKGLSS